MVSLETSVSHSRPFALDGRKHWRVADAVQKVARAGVRFHREAEAHVHRDAVLDPEAPGRFQRLFQHKTALQMDMVVHDGNVPGAHS